MTVRDAATPPPLPALDVRTSPLLRSCLAEDRFHVADFIGEGPYPNHRAEKEEAEAYVSAAAHVLACPAGEAFAEDLQVYIAHMFPPWEIETARGNGTWRRLLAFAALQRALDEAMNALADASFDFPRPNDVVFEHQPDLFERLDRAGLLPLTPAEISDELACEGVVVHGGHALYPHPLLASMRELVGALVSLVGRPGLTVSIALHPHRVTTIGDVPRKLLEDYWSGIRITAKNLDSLDRHDTGVPSFHAADQDHPLRIFFPLLGTWFDWERRSRRDPNDPIKRLYVREVRPAHDRHGEPLVAAWNRELHAERDTKLRRFTHVDGKMCCYPAEAYAPSVIAANADPRNPAKSRKLWRVDGPLTDEEWATLVGLHFRGNDLIAEHFAEVFPGVFAAS